MNWTIERDAPDDAARNVLAHDRVWNAFALADLEPEMRPYTTISIARAGARTATLLVLSHPAFTVLSPGGDPDGVAALLDAVSLPPTATTQVLAEHLDLIAGRYPRPAESRPLLRMATNQAELRTPAAAAETFRLEHADLPDLDALYAASPENYFAPHMLELGIFFGIREDGELVAAGGTHVVATGAGISVLGSIFTLPHARGRGYAAAITAAVANATIEAGCDLVTLNVYADNAGAIRVYERLGFTTVNTYWSWDADLASSPVRG